MSQSRARATEAKAKGKPKRSGPTEGKLSASTELKVARIADMMRGLEWERGVTGKLLAKEWRVGQGWVEKLAAIASRRVRAEFLDDKDHVGATVGAALSRGVLDAARTGDLSALARLAKVYADVAGVSAATKVEATVGVSLDELESLRDAAMQNESSGE